VQKIEEEYLKLESTIDEVSEQFTINLGTTSDNIFSDTEPTRGGEISGVDHLDS
jgi:hypothetical protein